MTLLLLHAASTCFLAGLTWTVQLVVYPSFALVGKEEWSAFHAAHSRRIALVVGLPWAVQGASLAGLLIMRSGSPWLLATAAACALGTVVLTVAGAVPVHGRLDTFQPQVGRQLLRISAWRTGAWTIGAGVSLALLATT